MNNWKPGDLCIINTFARPCSRHVVIVTKDEDGKLVGRYLSRHLERYEFPMDMLGNEPTPLEDFGVRLVVSRDKFYCSKVLGGESVATYHDGTTRYWQPESDFRDEIQPLNTEVYYGHI